MTTTETITYSTADALALTSTAQRELTIAAAVVIDSDDMMQLAGEDLRRIKGLQKDVEAKRTSIVAPLNAAVRAINDLFRAPAAYLADAESKLKSSMLTYSTEQERLARLARQEAERLGRIERERLELEARQQREAAAAAAAEAQAAAAAGDHAAAIAAQEAADQARELADANEATANVVTITPTVQAASKVSGISSRATYGAQVTDLMELVKAVAAGLAPIEALQADERFLGAQARAFKKAGPLYPGVTVTEQRTMSARAT